MSLVCKSRNAFFIKCCKSIYSSLLVTTSFSQDAIFYAGETVSCTISFTHSVKESTKTIHQRAQSLPSFDLNKVQPNVIPNRPPTLELETFPLTSLTSRKMSLSSLASSTFSYLTGSTKDPESIADTREWKDLSGNTNPKIYRKKKLNQDFIESVLDNIPSDTTIELEHEETPRSSIDTRYTTSRRSSIDSTMSNIPRHPRLHRLSSTRATSFTAYRNEHLLWGSAQVIGQFVSDPTLVDTNVFAPLKSKAMYHPLGASSGGGTLTSSSLKKGS